MSGACDSTFEELIEVKRDGAAHTEEEMFCVVDSYTRGETPDYQMAAWLMATLLNGLDSDETVWLTDAMVRTGHVLDLSSIEGKIVDKHSTGGVADTTTLVLAPLVASCGAFVAKMSGRGLGHTGGTLDKLESIPGFRVGLGEEEFVRQVRDIGVAVISQLPGVAEADKRMYALRDVTATVPSIPLIVGSIISKKVAGGTDATVLDVKVGSGAFMKTPQEARVLADELTRVGAELGRRVECYLTDMDQPLGMAVGNAIEVAEAVETLRGEGPEALTEVCLTLGSRMLVLGDVATGEAEARTLLVDALESGRALERFAAWIEAQGGDARIVEDLSLLPASRLVRTVRAERDGYVAGFETEAVGRAAALLGAGRLHKEDDIDMGAGILLEVRVGDEVAAGDALATLRAADESRLDEGEARFRDAVSFSKEPPQPRSLFLD